MLSSKMLFIFFVLIALHEFSTFRAKTVNNDTNSRHSLHAYNQKTSAKTISMDMNKNSDARYYKYLRQFLLDNFRKCC